jgi:Spy/CpxP family protein refolding chaperone
MQKRTQMRSLMEQREAKLKTILTAEQLAKYKELQKEQIKNRRNNQGKKEEMDDMMMDEN